MMLENLCSGLATASPTTLITVANILGTERYAPLFGFGGDVKAVNAKVAWLYAALCGGRGASTALTDRFVSHSGISSMPRSAD